MNSARAWRRSYTKTDAAPGEPKNKLAVEGTVVSERNFATLRFSGPKKERVLTITVRDGSGKAIWEKAIPAVPAK